MSDSQTAQARVPGKLILGGEHAVVYGRPALALAVRRYAEASVDLLDAPICKVTLADRETEDLSIDGLVARIDARYEAFEKGDLSVSDILDAAEELVAYACQLAAPGRGAQIRITSDIPLGCGMGSSAAILLAVCAAVAPTASWEMLYDWVLRSEMLQHGHSSGLDPWTCLQGGVQLFSPKCRLKISDAHLPEFTAIFTGIPECSTGECVTKVREQFGDDDRIWGPFESVVKAMCAALDQPDAPGLLNDAVRRNHRLLEGIGVVPEKVAGFISQIEALGGAAKTCGAGAICGDPAGMVAAFGPGEEIEACARRYGYTCYSMEVDYDGLQILD